MEDKLKVKLWPWQDDFIFGEAKFKFLKSSWATGKTLALVLAAMYESETYSDNLGVIFREEFEDLRDSTCKDFESLTGIKVDSSRNAKVVSSTIMFRHLEELNNIQNMNLGWFGIEQGEESKTDDRFYKLWGRLRRQNASRKGYVIANAAGHNWIYKIKQTGLIEPETGKRLDAHYEAKTHDCASVLAPDYLSSLEILKVKKPHVYNRFVLNSDDPDDLDNVIIKPLWVEGAKSRNLLIRYPLYRIVSIDVARGGGDKSVFYAMENYKVIGREEHNTRNTMELVAKAQIFARGLGVKAFAVDEIGVGGGVADRLVELGHQVIMVNAAVKEGVPPPYYNRRSQIIGFGAEMFEAGRVQIQADDEDLTEQLSWTQWRPLKSTGILQAQNKEEVQKEYGRSPDNADAFLNGLWALSQVEPMRQEPAMSGYSNGSGGRRFNPMTV